jgi:hypothetical protein
MKIVIVWGALLAFCMVVANILNVSPLAVPDERPHDLCYQLGFKLGNELWIGIHEIHRPIYQFLPLILSFIYALYQKNKTQVVIYKNRNEISNFTIFLDYYSLLLPNFLFFGCFVILCVPLPLILFDIHLITLDLLATIVTLACFMLPGYILLFFILFWLKFIYDNNTNITLKMANDIFTNFTIKDNYYRENKMFIEKFSFYLNKTINNIDSHLTKGVKIEDLEHDETLSIKKVIARNLHIYLRYCTQNELDTLKYNLNYLSNLIINENLINSLEVAKPIFKIYVDIKDFLIKQNYKVHGQKIYLKFSILFYVILLFLLGFYFSYHHPNGFSTDIYKNLQIWPIKINLPQAIFVPVMGTIFTRIRKRYLNII